MWTDETMEGHRDRVWTDHHLSKWAHSLIDEILLMILICDLQNTRHSLTGPSPEYRLKEKYYIRKIEINNLDDTEGN